MFYRICLTGAILCFLLAASITVAYVYDVEPVSPEKEYILEKEAFERQNECWAREFPCFAEWCAHRESCDARFLEWIGNLTAEAANEFAASCEMSFAQLKAWCHARGTTVGDYQWSTGDYGGIAPDPYDEDNRKP